MLALNPGSFTSSDGRSSGTQNDNLSLLYSVYKILEKNSKSNIGMNTTANKLFHVSNLIGLDMLNLEFVHLKKLAKIQFLKNGKT